MTEKKRKTLVFGTLVVAIIWGVWNNPLSSPGNQTTSVAEPMESDALIQQTAQTDSVRSGQTQIENVWRGDPFARRGVARSFISEPQVESRPSFSLSAVSESGESRMAIINGQVVAPGDRVDGWIVSRIGDGTVTLADGENKITLSMANR